MGLFCLRGHTRERREVTSLLCAAYAAEWGISMRVIDRLSLAILIIGGLNWGGVGLFGMDMVAALFGGSDSIISRVVYILVCISALWCITLFFREETREDRARGTA